MDVPNAVSDHPPTTTPPRECRLRSASVPVLSAEKDRCVRVICVSGVDDMYLSVVWRRFIAIA